jgi:hypothetical protein
MTDPIPADDPQPALPEDGLWHARVGDPLDPDKPDSGWWVEAERKSPDAPLEHVQVGSVAILGARWTAIATNGAQGAGAVPSGDRFAAAVTWFERRLNRRPSQE